MTKFITIADDLTGANANCSLMKKIGLDAAALFDIKAGVPEGYGMVAITTDSRAMPEKDAYDSVKEVLEDLEPNERDIYSKRLDSTLRGNLGPELNAFFDILGEDYIGIAVPAYPDTGRIVVNGIMLVNGELLVNSDAGRDTKTPVDTSDALNLLSKGLNHKSKMIYLEDIEKGEDHIRDLVLKAKEEGYRLLAFDGVTEDHLEAIAKGVINSGVKYFAADPGPFTMELGREILEKKEVLSKVLMVVGSVTDISVQQIKELLSDYDVRVLKVDAGQLADYPTRKEEIERASQEAMAKLGEDDILLVTTTPFDVGEKRLDLKKISEETGMNIDDISIMISNGLASIADKVVSSHLSFAGVFMSGGDITVAFVKEMEALGIDIREEVIPLAAYGRLIGGKKDRLRIISKGGMVGNADALKICLEKLKKE